MPIFDGLPQLCDQWLGVDDAWPGQPPRYKRLATINRLAREGWNNPIGMNLVRSLDQRIFDNWNGTPSNGIENWRFEKQEHLGDNNNGPEVTLERTITKVTDCNWANQVPTASGVVETATAHNVDLIHRCGSHYSFVELKVNADTPLFAAFEILQYGLVFAFFRNNVQRLGYLGFPPERLQILRADAVHLRVLAPALYYRPEWLEWLRPFENALNTELQGFSTDVLGIPMDFGFEAFPDQFNWEENIHNRNNVEVRRNVLWALRTRNLKFKDDCPSCRSPELVEIP